MVRNYKRKTPKLSYTDGQMELAIQSVKDGKSYKSTAIKHGVPRSTLQKKVKMYDDTSHAKANTKEVAIGFRPVFNCEQEAALAAYINDMESRLIGLSVIDLRRLAFEFAEKLKTPHNFNREKALTGKDWLAGFMARNNLANRKPEHTSAARAKGFNQESVAEFFSLLKDILEKYNFTPDRIWNVDETGISVVPKTSPRVTAKKGKRQVAGKTVAERGETVATTNFK